MSHSIGLAANATNDDNEYEEYEDLESAIFNAPDEDSEA